MQAHSNPSREEVERWVGGRKERKKKKGEKTVITAEKVDRIKPGRCWHITKRRMRLKAP